MENTNRSVFSIHGVTGMLIATVLLLSILTVLTIFSIKAQQEVANKPYTITNTQAIKTRDRDNSKLKVIEK